MSVHSLWLVGIWLFDNDCKLISLIVLILCSGQNSSIAKGYYFLIMQNSVMVLVLCISSHLSINEVYVDTSYTFRFCVMLQTKFKCEKN